MTSVPYVVSPARRTSGTGERAAAVAPVLCSLAAPVAATAYGMAAWRFASDMNWLGDFVIASGLFSRWQVWLAAGAAMQAAIWLLSRKEVDSDGSA